MKSVGDDPGAFFDAVCVSICICNDQWKSG